jgi:hypothetical protein
MKTVRIPIDGGNIVRSQNGTIKIGAGKLRTWLILFALAAFCLCGAVLAAQSWIDQGIPQLTLGDALELAAEAAAIVGLGFGLVFVLRSLFRPAATIDPAARLIVRGRGGAQKIPFADVAQILTSTREAGMEGVLVGGFSLLLKDGTTVELGSVSGQPKRLPARMEQIETLLTEALGLPARFGAMDERT